MNKNSSCGSEKACGDDPKVVNKDASCGPEKALRPWLSRVSYLRGLDGDVASASAQAQSAARSDKGSKDEKEKSKDEPLERADGTSQFDYLRRVVEQVNERVHELHPNSAGEVLAIGVLGSDFYDKLLVLQALRERFPKTLFFTTDLDARLMQPAHYRWTRNLLVGSSHGLELNAGLQQTIPPFRNVYQTATFLASQLALSEMDSNLKRKKLTDWLRAPRVYEIGRTQAFALQPNFELGAVRVAGNAACETLDKCDDIRPRLPGLLPHMHPSDWAIVMSGIALLVLLYLYNRRVRRSINAIPQAIRRSRLLRLWIALLVVLGAYCAILIVSAEHGEPFAWAEGISLWPTQILRLMALALCVWFIFRTLWPDEKVLNAIQTEFFPEPLDEKAAQKIERDARGHRTLLEWFNKYPDPCPGIHACTLWHEYRALESWHLRRRRLLVPALTYAFVCLGLILSLGGFPNTPYRGDESKWLSIGLLSFLVIAFIVLLIAVVDSIRLGSTFTRNLTKGRSEYSAEAMRNFRASINLGKHQPGAYLCDWIDARLIARVTERIGQQVYYPFIILSLMLVARSPLFDYWHTTTGLILVFVFGFALTIACAIVLQNAAERARDIALERLTTYISQVSGHYKKEGSAATVAQLGQLRDEVKNLRRGAYLPFSQQPLVRAILVPIGSFGGLQLIEYFVLSSYL